MSGFAVHAPVFSRARGRETPLDRDYWLAHCEGFRVECDGSRLGFIEEIRADELGGDILCVRAGFLGRRLLFIPADQVAMIVPRDMRVYLHSSPTLLGSDAVCA